MNKAILLLQHYAAIILLVYVLLLLIPILVIFWVARVTKRERAKSVVPFGELQRRPAGESARVKLEKYTDSLNEWLTAVVFIPVLFTLVIATQRETSVALIVPSRKVTVVSRRLHA